MRDLDLDLDSRFHLHFLIWFEKCIIINNLVASSPPPPHTHTHTHFLLFCHFQWHLGEECAGLPTCTDFRGTYRFWPSITISRFHAVVYRFWKMRQFLGSKISFCFVLAGYTGALHQNSPNPCHFLILSASCTYRRSGCCVAAINSPPQAMN